MPDISLTASTLTEIAEPLQAVMLNGVYDSLVPSGRVVRDLNKLAALKEAFSGRIRLIVNEACLPGCPFRTQHFFEMAGGSAHPKSLCDELLSREPWLRMTGAWILPQHLDLYDGYYDELKLAGRVTLRDPEKYLRVLRAYVHSDHMTPDEIGGGPASVQQPMHITDELYARTLICSKRCDQCSVCQDYYEAAAVSAGQPV